MKKKKIICSVIILLLVASLCFYTFASAEIISLKSDSDAETIFKDRLSKCLTAPIAGPIITKKGKEAEETLKNLLNFSEEYPNSKYADDAQYIYLIYNSLGVVAHNMYMVVALEKLTKKYPNGKIEDSTIEFMKGIFRPYDWTLPEFYMPYDLALVYFRVGKAFEERNYSEVVKYCSEFIERADENNPNIRKLLSLPYLYLLVSYKKLGKMTEGEKIKSKMTALYPEKKEQIESIWQK